MLQILSIVAPADLMVAIGRAFARAGPAGPEGGRSPGAVTLPPWLAAIGPG